MDSQDKQEKIKIYSKGDFNSEEFEKEGRYRWKNKDLLVSLQFALTGVITAIKEEKNIRRHLISSVLVIIAGLIFRIERLDWLFLFLAIFLVISAELFNSSIENVVDLASDYRFYMRAKRSKDMAAGAVLVLSAFAVLVGLFIFLPKIGSLIF
ncbi:MAG: diacylglycerol kinase family protein [Lactovum sp.]